MLAINHACHEVDCSFTKEKWEYTVSLHLSVIHIRLIDEFSLCSELKQDLLAALRETVACGCSLFFLSD